MNLPAIRTEAYRIARNLVKKELKRNKIKVSWVESRQITEAVKYLLKAEPDIYKQAKREIKRRERLKLR